MGPLEEMRQKEVTSQFPVWGNAALQVNETKHVHAYTKWQMLTLTVGSCYVATLVSKTYITDDSDYEPIYHTYAIFKYIYILHHVTDVHEDLNASFFNLDILLYQPLDCVTTSYSKHFSSVCFNKWNKLSAYRMK